MRSLFRLVAPVAAALAIALAGASSALAAPAGVAILPLDDDWCFTSQYGGPTYCFDVEGQATIVENDAGSKLMVNQRLETTVIENGVVVSEISEVSVLNSRYGADGSGATQEVFHTSVTWGGATCTFATVLRIADFDVVVDHGTEPVCH